LGELPPPLQYRALLTVIDHLVVGGVMGRPLLQAQPILDRFVREAPIEIPALLRRCAEQAAAPESLRTPSLFIPNPGLALYTAQPPALHEDLN